MCGSPTAPAPGLSSSSTLWFLQPLHLPALGSAAAVAAAVLFYLLAVALLFGFATRMAAAGLALWCFLVLMTDFAGSFSINRSSILILLVLAASPSGHVLSLDAVLRARRSGGAVPPPLAPTISAWPIRTLQWFLLCWYVLAGLFKVSVDWSFFRSNDVLYSQLQGWYMNDLSFWVLHHVPRPWLGILQQLSLYFEVFAPIWFLPAWLRPWGMLVGVGMHVSIALLMSGLWYFSAELLSLYCVFLPVSVRWLAAGGRR